MAWTPPLGFGDLNLDAARLREAQWNKAGLESGYSIPDTSAWTVIDVTQSPYTADKTGVADSRATIQAAIDSTTANRIIYLPAGTYRLNEPIYLRSNKVLRGDGMTQTELRAYGKSTGVNEDATAIQILESSTSNWYSMPPHWTISAGHTTGSNQVTVSDSTGLTIGDYVQTFVTFQATSDFDSDWKKGPTPEIELAHPIVTNYLAGSGYRPGWFQQANKITDIQGNVIILKDKIRWGENAWAPQLRILKGVSNSAIENLTVKEDDTNTNTSINVPMVRFRYGNNCWFYRARFTRAYTTNFYTDNTYQCLMRDCYVGDRRFAWIQGQQYKYNFSFEHGTTNWLIENSYFDKHREAIAVQRCSSGNVVAYCYIGESRTAYNEGQSAGLFQHGIYPLDNLYEGNHLFSSIIVDKFWGRNGHFTAFRNRMDGSGADPDINGYHFQKRDVGYDDIENSDWSNIVANHAYALSEYGKPLENALDYDSKGDVINCLLERNVFTYVYLFGPAATNTDDNNVTAQKMPAGWSGFTIPSSMYLSAKPSWWPTGKAWPLTGSDLDDRDAGYVNIPAQDWYDGGNITFPDDPEPDPLPPKPIFGGNTHLLSLKRRKRL